MYESSRVWKGQDGPSKHGETLPIIVLPALSMTRARVAHNHFRMQVQKRAVSEPRREAIASSLRNGLNWEQNSRQVNDQIYNLNFRSHTSLSEIAYQSLPRAEGRTNSRYTENPWVLKDGVEVVPTLNI